MKTIKLRNHKSLLGENSNKKYERNFLDKASLNFIISISYEEY